MSTVISNKTPYLRTSRNFPTDPQALTVEVNRSYVDIANAVNARTIGIFATTPIISGNSWYLSGGSSKQQTIRQIYPFTFVSSPVTIIHGIALANIFGFAQIYGTFTNGTNWYPLPYVDQAAANNQISLYVDPTNINITVGAGSPPSIASGFVVLEWISQI